MRSILSQSLLAVALLLLLGPQAAAAKVDPGAVVRDTTKELLRQVDANRETLKQDQTRLFELVEQTIMPVVDFDYFSRLVLGKYWRRADDNQRERFLAQFRTLLVRSYAAHLLDHREVTIEYGETRRQDEGRATVTTTVDIGAAEPVPVKYVMHLRDGEWQAYDVIVAGVSTVVTFRNQFYQEIARQGLDGFIEKLASKNELAVPDALKGKGD